MYVFEPLMVKLRYANGKTLKRSQWQFVNEIARLSNKPSRAGDVVVRIEQLLRLRTSVEFLQARHNNKLAVKRHSSDLPWVGRE